MGIKKIVFLAAFLAIFGQSFAASSRTYGATCKAWQPDGKLVYRGLCEVSIGIPGMSESLVYQVSIHATNIEIRLTENQCEFEGKPCIFSHFKYRNIMRSTNEDGSILEFTAPPKDSF